MAAISYTEHVQLYVNDQLSAARSTDILIIFFVRSDALRTQPLMSIVFEREKMRKRGDRDNIYCKWCKLRNICEDNI